MEKYVIHIMWDDHSYDTIDDVIKTIDNIQDGGTYMMFKRGNGVIGSINFANAYMITLEPVKEN